MTDEEWRVTIVMTNTATKDQLLGLLTDNGTIVAAGSSLSADGNRVFVYGPSQDAVEQSVVQVRSALDALEVEPVRVEFDQWLPDSGRWGEPGQTVSTEGGAGDTDDEPPKEEQGWLSTIIDGLMGGTPS